MSDFKNIHIGSIVEIKWKDMKIPMEKTCDFLNCSEDEIHKMFVSIGIESELLLRWSQLLQYDFFRIYSQHMILYAPQGSIHYISKSNSKKIISPQFRKNLYTKEVIRFIVDLVDRGAKSKQKVIDEYRIPKTTLYKWIDKYGNKS